MIKKQSSGFLRKKGGEMLKKDNAGEKEIRKKEVKGENAERKNHIIKNKL